VFIHKHHLHRKDAKFAKKLINKNIQMALRSLRLCGDIFLPDLEINPVDDVILELFPRHIIFRHGSAAHRYSCLVDGVRVSGQQRVPPVQ